MVFSSVHCGGGSAADVDGVKLVASRPDKPVQVTIQTSLSV